MPFSIRNKVLNLDLNLTLAYTSKVLHKAHAAAIAAAGGPKTNENAHKLRSVFDVANKAVMAKLDEIRLGSSAEQEEFIARHALTYDANREGGKSFSASAHLKGYLKRASKAGRIQSLKERQLERSQTINEVLERRKEMEESAKVELVAQIEQKEARR